MIYDALRLALREDEADPAAFEDRGAEPVGSYAALLRGLKEHGTI
jgi:hypothetical protein